MTTRSDVFYLGADPSNPRRLFWLPMKERRAHLAVTGATGTGKSNLVLDLLGQDVIAGRGCGLIDAKGDTAEDILACLAASPENEWATLARDLVILDLADPNCSVSFNPLEVRPYASPSRQRQDVVSVIKRVFNVDDTRVPRLGLVLPKALQLLMESGGGLTLCDLPRILTDTHFRNALVQRSTDPALRRFWELEFPESPANQAAWVGSTLLRLELLLDDPLVQRFLGQPRSSFDFRTLMDQGKVFIANLGKGSLGQETAHLIGGFLIVALQLAAESRQQIFPAEARRPWYLYIDEAQNYVNTRSFEELLCEARGYGLSLNLAHQHLSQLDEGFRHAILSNARIRVAFRVSYEDATLLAREFWRYDGQRLKETRWETVRLSRNIYLPLPEPVYFSAGDEQRQNRERLHYLGDRLAWVHLQGDAAPTLVRTVEMPRAELAAARERVVRFKELVGRVHRQPALEVPESRPQLAAGRSFEWAGRPKPSQPVRP